MSVVVIVVNCDGQSHRRFSGKALRINILSLNIPNNSSVSSGDFTFGRSYEKIAVPTFIMRYFRQLPKSPPATSHLDGVTSKLRTSGWNKHSLKHYVR
jgi:hypothetical protein